ncbi:hypothetical protein [Microbacterium sp. NPDC087868]|uniref:hypothetical protein n=1 Tax=Microbacterium sp. NPDC087868 TaxID=3364195 RepID=UPI00384DA2DF
MYTERTFGLIANFARLQARFRPNQRRNGELSARCLQRATCLQPWRQSRPRNRNEQIWTLGRSIASGNALRGSPVQMYISSLRELRDAVEDHFGKTARYLATHRSESHPERGYVQFLLYEALCFYFVVLERPYSSLGVSRRVEGEAPISDFILVTCLSSRTSRLM